MLYMCNGPMKSGSTWLCQILLRLVDPLELPAEFQAPGWTAPSIQPGLFFRFVIERSLDQETYVSKSHWMASDMLGRLPAHVAASLPNVCVFSIFRDIRDSVVSKYYHDRKHNGYQAEFNEWIETRGRSFAIRLLRFHWEWQNLGIWHTFERTPFIVRYETLLENPHGSVLSIAQALGVECDDAKASSILAEINAVRDLSKQKGSGGTFRKGVSGDWINHFTDDNDRMIKEITDEHKMPELMSILEMQFIKPSTNAGAQDTNGTAG